MARVAGTASEGRVTTVINYQINMKTNQKEKSVCQNIKSGEYLKSDGGKTTSLKAAEKFPLYADVPLDRGLGIGWRMMSVYSQTHPV